MNIRPNSLAVFSGRCFGSRATAFPADEAAPDPAPSEEAAEAGTDMEAADNTASQAMLLKAGYTLRGTLLNWLRHGELYKNALIYQLSTRQATE